MIREEIERVFYNRKYKIDYMTDSIFKKYKTIP